MRSLYRIDPAPKQTRQRRAVLLRIAVPVILLLIALGLHRVTRRLEALQRSPYPVVRVPPFNHKLAARPTFHGDGLSPEEAPIQLTLRSGETLDEVLRNLGLEPQEAHQASQALAEHIDPRKLKAGSVYAAYFGPASSVVGFELELSGQGRVELERGEDGWSSRWREYERAVRLRAVSGELNGYLEASLSEAGGDTRLAWLMSEALQWDLDFNRDLRVGDRFEVLYEEVYLDGRYWKPGEIQALIYENEGRRLEAYRWGESGHYDAEGRPLRKLFLRSPIPYSRVTSRFSSRRFHPVLKRYRPHYGIDYAAPTGTAVRATASGVVASVGWDRGGGKTVKVRHSNDYLTAYLHLSRYARGIRRGVRVSQGQVIGYVGSTGLASGPHLDYRVQHRGRWINPLALKNEPAPLISTEEMPQFLARRDMLRHSLEQRRASTTAIAQMAPARGTDAGADSDPGARQHGGRR